MKTEKLLFVVSVVLCAAQKQTRAQDYQRVAPQVMSTTIVIDQNTTRKELKEQALFALKNISDENAQSVFLILEACVKVGQEKFPAAVFNPDEHDNELRFIVKQLSALDETVLLTALKSKITTARYGAEADQKAIGTLEKWARKKPKAGTDRLDNKILKKITPLLDLGLISYDFFKKGSPPVTLKNFADQLLNTLPAVIGLNVEETARIRAMSEIIFSLQHKIEDIQFESTAQGIMLKLDAQVILEITTNDVNERGDPLTNHDLLLKILDSISQLLKTELIDRLGFDDPAVEHFDVFYSKIKAKALRLKDDPSLHLVLAMPVKDFIDDFKSIKGSVATLASYKTELGKIYWQKVTTARTAPDQLSQTFAKDFYLNSFLELAGDFIGDKLNTALKNPTRVAWLNNFNISESTTELSTTIAYKIVNRPRLVWELSTNAFFNRSAVKDTSKSNGVGQRIIAGSSLKYISINNQWEFSFNSAASSSVITQLSDLRKATPDAYLGVSVACKWKEFVFRPFFEYEYQRLIDDSREKQNVGLEVRFPAKFILGGLFVSQQINGNTSFGISFPVVK